MRKENLTDSASVTPPAQFGADNVTITLSKEQARQIEEFFEFNTLRFVDELIDTLFTSTMRESIGSVSDDDYLAIMGIKKFVITMNSISKQFKS